jgi:hypothetical protein
VDHLHVLFRVGQHRAHLRNETPRRARTTTERVGRSGRERYDEYARLGDSSLIPNTTRVALVLKVLQSCCEGVGFEADVL